MPPKTMARDKKGILLVDSNDNIWGYEFAENYTVELMVMKFCNVQMKEQEVAMLAIIEQTKSTFQR